MPASLRETRNRIRSVTSTAKITRAMELIAASRVMRAQANARVEVVDTTGAGDAFVGAAAASLLTDDDLDRACAAGVAAGAAAVQHRGAQPEL